MEEALLSYLRGDSATTGLVGDRAYWIRRPQGSNLPALVLTRVGRQPDYVMSGPSGLHESRVQVDCYAGTYAAVKALSRAVIARASGVRLTHGGTEFQAIMIDGERDSFEADPNSSERLFRVSFDLLIWHD